MKHLAAAAALLLLLAPAVAAQGDFQGQVTSIRVGENATVNATITNPLPIGDTLVVVFGGESIEQGIVTPFYKESEGITCKRLQSRCELQLGPNEERDLQVVLEGTAIGQGTMSATVNSSTTQLSSTDKMEVRVKPYFEPVTVSAPGLQGPQLLVLALLGALATVYLFRD